MNLSKVCIYGHTYTTQRIQVISFNVEKREGHNTNMCSPLISGLCTHRRLFVFPQQSAALMKPQRRAHQAGPSSCVWLVRLLFLKVRGSQPLNDYSWPQQIKQHMADQMGMVDAILKQMQCILGGNKLASQINFAHVNSKHVVDSLGYNHADLLKPICVLRVCKLFLFFSDTYVPCILVCRFV